MLFDYFIRDAIRTSTSIRYGEIPHTKFAGKTYTLKDFEFGNHTKPSLPDNHPMELSCVFNSFGYRCAEFDSPRGEINVISFGCSETVGIGVSVENRFSGVFCRLLGEITGKIVVDWNLGVPAKSNDFIARCAPSAIRCLNPDIVLACFTYMGRREYIDYKGQIYDFLVGVPIGKVPANMVVCWQSLINLNNRYYDLTNFCHNVTIVEQTAKLAGVPCLYAFVADESDTLEKSASFVGYFVHEDYAIDGIHAGRTSHQKLGERFFAKYHVVYSPKTS